VTDFGAIGTKYETEMGPQVGAGTTFGPPVFWNPLNRAIGTKYETSRGPQVFIGSYVNGAVPYLAVTQIVAEFGQSGGGVSVF
jgi:hypothetical protein